VNTLEVGALGPHFTLLGIDGREYSLPGSRGEGPLLIVFLRSTCPTCDVAFPYIGKLVDAYDGFDCWAVSQDDPKAAAAYAKRLGMTYPVLVDAPALEVSTLYDPPSTPTMFLLDESGLVDFVGEGFAKSDLNEVSALIAGNIGSPVIEVAPPGDGRPEMKPGCMARQRMPRRR
jgi:peroxiredoxin